MRTLYAGLLVRPTTTAPQDRSLAAILLYVAVVLTAVGRGTAAPPFQHYSKTTATSSSLVLRKSDISSLIAASARDDDDDLYRTVTETTHFTNYSDVTSGDSVVIDSVVNFTSTDHSDGATSDPLMSMPSAHAQDTDSCKYNLTFCLENICSINPTLLHLIFD